MPDPSNGRNEQWEWLRPHGYLRVTAGLKLQAAFTLRCVAYRVPQDTVGPGWRVAADRSMAWRWFPSLRLEITLACPVARFSLVGEYCERPAQVDCSRTWRDMEITDVRKLGPIQEVSS